MIRTRTIFVLGAGASKPFGYPTGAELRSDICEMAPGTAVFDAVIRAGHDTATVILFKSQFERSGFHSVDRFLAMRPALDIIGRDTIAAAILSHYEDGFVHGHPQRGRGDADWYGYLWNRMVDGASSPQQVVAGNNVAFITFNYDTSLEQFFFNAIGGGFGLGREMSLELASRIQIHHVYGALAATDEERYYNRLPGIPSKPGALRSISSNLAVMPHHRPEVDQKTCAWLAEAHRIVYLGFGYDEMNCERLGIAQARMPPHSEGSRPKVRGTALNLTEAERKLAEARVTMGHDPHLMDETCLQFLREVADWLT